MPDDNLKPIDYKEAGVDIEAGENAVRRIKDKVRSTFNANVLSELGSFGGLYRIDDSWNKPVLVSSTDGVGTKLLVAIQAGVYHTVGQDLVNHCVNDILVQGAKPLFFLDYLATGKIELEKSVQIVDGIVQGCKQAGCTLLGGETAEMPGFYQSGDYDLAGFCVGVVEQEKLIDGSTISINDCVIGLASSGLHSNGYSLARKVLLEKGRLSLNESVHGMKKTIGQELLEPTRIYVKSLLNIFKSFNIKGLVHITGGGFYDNIPRIIPEVCRCVITTGSWKIPPIFSVIRDIGHVDEEEMFRVFNMGIGMMMIVAEKESQEILDRLKAMGEAAYLIGTIEKKESNQASVCFTGQ